MKKRFLFAEIVLVNLLFSIEGLGQWEKISSPEISIPIATHAVAVKGDTIFAGAYRGTIYRSMNNGLTWMEVDSGLSPNFYLAFTFLISGDTIFAGTYDGVYRSTNWGETWMLLSSGLPSPPYVYSIMKKDSMLFAGTSYGVFRSDNNGDNWFPARSGLPQNNHGNYMQVTSIIVLGNTIYCGVYGGVIYELGGVYKSLDNGMTWSPATVGLPGRVHSLLSDGNILFAASDYDSSGSVYRSTNYGNSWTSTSAGLSRQYNGLYWNYKPVYALAAAGGTLFAGVQDAGAYCSTNGGASWVELNSGLPPNPSYFITSFAVRGEELFLTSFNGMYRLNIADSTWYPVFTVYPGEVQPWALGAGANNLFAFFAANFWNGTAGGMYRSTNHGNQWLPDSSLPGAWFFSIERVDNELYALGGSLFRSSDDGMSWTRIDSGFGRGGITSLVVQDSIFFVSKAGYILNGDVGGVYRSTDQGRSWSSAGLEWSPVRSLAFHRGVLFGAVRGYTTKPGLYRSMDKGNNWIVIDSLLPNQEVPFILTTFDNQVFASTANQGILVTSDSGQHWTQFNTGLLVDTSGKYPLVSDFHIINSVLVTGTDKGVYILRGNGGTWQNLNDDLPSEALSTKTVTATCDMLYIRTDHGIWQRPISEFTPTVVLQVEGNWNMLSLPIIVSDYSKRSLFPVASSYAYTYENGYIPNDTLQNGRGYWLKFSSTTSIPIFGTNIILDTIKIDKNWNMIGSISNPVSVSTIGSIPHGLIVSQFYTYQVDSGNYVVSDTIEPGKGYWVKVSQTGKLILSSTSNIPASSRINIVPIEELPPPPPNEHSTGGGKTPKIPTQFALGQNYPNPFNPKTTIMYSIPHGSHVSLKVFDVLGREVAVLVNEEKSAGEYSVAFDALNLPSGVYFYQLQTNSYRELKKMLILK